MPHVVLIETSGNQQYIFETNKLRENIGASELTWSVGKWVLDAVEKQDGPFKVGNSPKEVRDSLLNPELNPRIEDGKSPVEVIIATSGKALLLVKDQKTGQEIIHHVTMRALEDAPGLDVRGVIERGFTFDTDSVHDAIGRAHQLFEAERSRRVGVEGRFLRLPVVAACATSGFPANMVDEPDSDGTRKPRSHVSLKKRDASEQGVERMRVGVVDDYDDPRILRSIKQLEDFDLGHGRPEWLAVIHADGNGLGTIFLDFEKVSKTQGQSRAYVDALRSFSIAIEECTVRAFREALKSINLKDLEQGDELKRKTGSATSITFLPVVPIVLGGDDLTIICDGRFALKLTAAYLSEFEKATGDPKGPQNGIVAQIARNVSPDHPRLAACAGVAIVKPHFPFSNAYKLAENLTKSAKVVKKRFKSQAGVIPCSAIDVHVLYDSSGADLERIRSKLELDDGQVQLTARPFVVTNLEPINDADEAAMKWAKRRHWSELLRRTKLILAQDDAANGNEGRRKLPNSMLHDLRESLFLGKEEAMARLKLYIERYGKLGLKEWAEDGEHPLFWSEEDQDVGTNGIKETRFFTTFLDAMDLAEFVKHGELK